MTLVCLHALCLSSESSKFFKCSLRSMSMIDLIIGCWIEAHPSSNRTTIWIIKGKIDILIWTFWYGHFDRDISIGTFHTQFDRDFHTHSHRDFLIGTFSLTLIGTFSLTLLRFISLISFISHPILSISYKFNSTTFHRFHRFHRFTFIQLIGTFS